MEDITIDPRDFIHEPFTVCPKCNEQEFGKLSTHHKSYTKRCRACFHDARYTLPELQKRIIYLDQFFVTQIAFEMNPDLGKQPNIFFSNAYKKIDLLRRAQIVVCPYSSGHEEESVIAHKYAPYLKDAYKNFSGATQFSTFDHIERFQILRGFKEWLKDNSSLPTDFEKYEFVQGGALSWEEWYYIDVQHPWKAEYTETIRKSRESVFQGMEEVFHRWQNDRDKNFKDWYAEEVQGVGPHYFNVAKTVFTELSQGNVDRLFQNEYITFRGLLDIAEKHLPVDECITRVVAYLTSPFFKSLPFVSIQGALFASIAHEAAHTLKKQPPNIGTNTDISVISRLLPYCDVMFIDKGMHQYLKHPEVQKALNNRFNGKIYSLSTRDEFLNYLNSLIEAISQEHLELLLQVYGQELVDEVVEVQNSLKP